MSIFPVIDFGFREKYNIGMQEPYFGKANGACDGTGERELAAV